MSQWNELFHCPFCGARKEDVEALIGGGHAAWCPNNRNTDVSGERSAREEYVDDVEESDSMQRMADIPPVEREPLSGAGIIRFKCSSIGNLVQCEMSGKWKIPGITTAEAASGMERIDKAFRNCSPSFVAEQVHRNRHLRLHNPTPILHEGV